MSQDFYSNNALPEIHVQIVHIDGPRKSEIDESQAERISIGRDPNGDVVFPGDLRIVSRLHAELVREGNRFLLVCKGANGCFINGNRVEQAYLKAGDVITLAEGGPKISYLSKMVKQSKPAMRPPPQVSPGGLGAGLDQFAASPQIPKTNVPEEASFTFQFGINIKSLKKSAVRLGRSDRADFSLPHPSVYDLHAEVFHAQGNYFLRDLTSNRGTFINDRAIQGDTILQQNDVVMFGDGGPRLRFVGSGRFVE
ncbi:MAG: FHA domain-containing protein, partial [Gammaproteobacteria bacterium]|nr:FHA domain-containing protein [Gammaproteobacteria bacterium]